VIGFDVQEGVPDPFPKVKEFRKKHQLTYPLVSDENGIVMQKFGMIALPTILIIDKHGKYAAHPATVPEIVSNLQKLAP